MELAYISLDKLQAMDRALEYQENGPIAAAIETFGIVRPVVVNRNGHTILNPLDYDAIAAQGIDPAPVLLVDFDPIHNTALSLIWHGGLDGWLNPIPIDDNAVMTTILRLLEQHPEKLRSLGPPLEYFQDLLDRAAGEAETRRPKPHQPQMEQAPPPMPTDTITAENLDMPLLDIGKQITEIPASFSQWGAKSRETRADCYHFYTDDSRFQKVVSEPDQLIQTGTPAAVEVNFTTDDRMPGALVMADIWRKRRLSQIWQAAGVEIVADLNVSDRFLDAAFMGIPDGWRAYANRASTQDLGHLHEMHRRAVERAGTDDIIYIVYGGDRARQICEAEGWHHVAIPTKRGRHG